MQWIWNICRIGVIFQESGFSCLSPFSAMVTRALRAKDKEATKIFYLLSFFAAPLNTNIYPVRYAVTKNKQTTNMRRIKLWAAILTYTQSVIWLVYDATSRSMSFLHKSCSPSTCRSPLLAALSLLSSDRLANLRFGNVSAPNCKISQLVGKLFHVYLAKFDFLVSFSFFLLFFNNDAIYMP